MTAIELRPYSFEDADLIVALYSDERLVNYSSVRRPSRAKACRMIALYRSYAQEFGSMWGIFDRSTGAYLGEVGARRESGNRATVSIALTAEAEGTGVALVALESALAIMSLNGVAVAIADIAANNWRSVAFFSKAGFEADSLGPGSKTRMSRQIGPDNDATQAASNNYRCIKCPSCGWEGSLVKVNESAVYPDYDLACNRCRTILATSGN